MTEPRIAPYGSWRSPITADLVASGGVGLGQVVLDGDDVYWIEQRPAEGGRNVVVRHTADGQTQDLTPAPLNARTRVHEYGGGAFAVDDGIVLFANYADQRLYRQEPGAVPRPLTPAVDLRYADGVVDRQRGLLFCVREDHTVEGREAVNTLVSLPLTDGGPGRVVVSGNDFYSSPRLSPDGSRLAWLTWHHPNMPWDGCELWVGELTLEGTITRSELVAGGPDESIAQPEWSPAGVLHFVSDRSGWWNLYRWREGRVEPICPAAAEFARPQWAFGMSGYGFESAGRIVCAYIQQGESRLGVIDTRTGQLAPIASPYTDVSQLRVRNGRAVFVAGSPAARTEVVRLSLGAGAVETLRRASDASIDPGYLSAPRAIEFPTEGGLRAHAFVYPPRNRDYAAPAGERPPLLVMSHGGPTSATSTELRLGHQYWTSRGIAVLDVNYGGSSGFGRDYRRRLNGQWGVVDVDDCINGARFLVESGDVDGSRLLIRGGSAGGYTTLCALAFRDAFRAGASHFGLSDLEVFVGDTHKYESRYLESLIGPYPARRDLYQARSPINFTDRLSCPVIFLQGLEDKIVPPNQAELMVAALRRKGLPVAYLAFEGEQHGFRRAENIKRALEAELYFYSKVLGFELGEPVEHVAIENLPA